MVAPEPAHSQVAWLPVLSPGSSRVGNSASNTVVVAVLLLVLDPTQGSPASEQSFRGAGHVHSRFLPRPQAEAIEVSFCPDD
jgi:hypothetical protein